MVYRRGDGSRGRGYCVLAGFCFAAGAVGAMDVENTVSSQSFVLLLGFLLLAFVCSFFFRSKFSATRTLPRLGTAGQPLRLSCGGEKPDCVAKNQTGLTLLEDVADPRPTFAEWLAFQLAEGRRVRPFRMSQRRRKNPFRIAALKGR